MSKVMQFLDNYHDKKIMIKSISWQTNCHYLSSPATSCVAGHILIFT